MQEKEQQKQEALEKLSHASSHYTGLKSFKSIERKIRTQRIKNIPTEPVEIMRPSGVPNLPSDNMNDIMTNQFMSEYVENKRIRDEIINNLRYQKLKKLKGVKTTKTDELRGNM